MRIGLLGGTFDPIHIGHLTLGEAVRTKLKLDKVLFVVAGNPYLKTERKITDARHRVEMVRLAIKGNPGFELSTLEVERGGPSYSVETVAELKEKYYKNDEIYFLLGWDNLLELPRWKEPARLVSLCYLAAVPRVGYPMPDLKVMEKEIPGIASKTIILDSPLINISATVVRERLSRGLSLKSLIPDAVIDYIRKNNLYRKTK